MTEPQPSSSVKSLNSETHAAPPRLGVRLLLHGTEVTKLWVASRRVWKRPVMVDQTFKILKTTKDF